MGRPRTTQERNQEIVELIKAGWSTTAVAAHYGVSRQRVHQIVQALSDGSGVVDVRGYTFGPTLSRLDRYRDDNIYAYVNETQSVSAIAKRFGVSHTGVRNWLIARGVPTRPKGWLTAQRATKLQELIDSGLSIGKAAKKIGISRPSAAQLIERGLVDSPYARYGKKYHFDIPDAVRRHAQGETYADIGRSLGIPAATVRSRVVYHSNKEETVDV